MGGRRVAGNDKGLDLLFDEEGGDLEAVTPHGLGTLRTVGNASGVAEVRHALAGKLLHHGVGHREATDSGIEDADGCFCCHHVSDAPTVAPPGATRIESSAGSSQRFAATNASAPEKRWFARRKATQSSTWLWRTCTYCGSKRRATMFGVERVSGRRVYVGYD